MALTIRKIAMPTAKYPVKCPYIMNPTRIVIHNTANDAPAENEIRYMQSNSAQTSFHFAVDEKEAVQGVELWRNAWHAGDGQGKGNREGIAIEICFSKSGGTRFEEAEKNAAELTAKLLLDFGWGLDRVTKHQDYSGKYCLPIDETELLTPNGWVNLGDVDVGDVVAQFNDGKIEFVPVQHIIEPYYADVVKARRIEATLNHDMVYKDQRSTEWKKDKWEKLLNKCISFIPVGGKYDTPGLPLSDDYIRYLVWTQADGHYAQRKSKYTGITHQLGIEFHFTKKRKVERLISVLEGIDQKYSYCERADGTYVIRIHDSKAREKVEKYLNNKMFSWKLLDMNDEQREVFINELELADGSTTNHAYFSTKQQNYDVVAAIAALHNQRCLQTTTGTSTALIFSSSKLTVPKDTEKSVRNTLVSCVTVPSGAILIRQYGQPKVVGNCPHRTLDLGWDRFLSMVEKKRRILAGLEVEETDDTTLNGYRIVRAKDFTINYFDAPKKSAQFLNYINGGFFGLYAESGITFTLPVGNLICDVLPNSLSLAAAKYISKHIAGTKLIWSTKDNATMQMRGKAVSTLVLPHTGTPYVDELTAAPASARYAISGIPVIRKGEDVSYRNFVKPQGWDDSPFYATKRNLIGLKGSAIYIISGTSKSSNFVATSEVYDALKPFGFDDCIALDGGGSAIFKYQGKQSATWENRTVNNIIRF